jgi:hypothetical protein
VEEFYSCRLALLLILENPGTKWNNLKTRSSRGPYCRCQTYPLRCPTSGFLLHTSIVYLLFQNRVGRRKKQDIPWRFPFASSFCKMHGLRWRPGILLPTTNESYLRTFRAEPSDSFGEFGGRFDSNAPVATAIADFRSALDLVPNLKFSTGESGGLNLFPNFAVTLCPALVNMDNSSRPLEVGKSNFRKPPPFR